MGPSGVKSDTMANPGHVDILKRSVESWNKWREENPELLPDLSGADLFEADLPRANLRRANLSHSVLQGAVLRDTDLTEANLENADLSGTWSANQKWAGDPIERLAWPSGAELQNADLRRAVLRGADLKGVDLIAANLSGADLRKAVLNGALLQETIFGDTDLGSAEGLEYCRHAGPVTIDYRTIAKSGKLPIQFLRGCGLEERFIRSLPALLNQRREYYSSFISYSHADKDFAKRLYDTLQDCGIRCWFDQKQILPGDDIYQQVDRGIKRWDKVLLCCSEHSLTSWWVDNEIGAAFEKEQQLMKERGAKVHAIIPLNLDDYIFSDRWKSGYQDQIRRRLAADFTDWAKDNRKYKEQLENVIQALRVDKGAREQPPLPHL